MALTLSIETATCVCSVALHADARLVAVQSLHMMKSHAETLLLTIQHLLAVSLYAKADLTAVAISSGPGSYTGLRIGAATAQGLCYALGIPLIAVNTLEAMAYGMQPYNKHRSLLCPMIDARRMKVYCLIADSEGAILEVPHARVIEKNSFSTWLHEHSVIFFGNGVTKCAPLLGFYPTALFVGGIYPTAENVGEFAYKKLQRGDFVKPESFVPLYLKSCN